MTLDKIIRELAAMRFEFVHRKAQRQPFQLFDRFARETVARFVHEADCRQFHEEYVEKFVAKITKDLHDAIPTENSVSIPQTGSSV